MDWNDLLQNITGMIKTGDYTIHCFLFYNNSIKPHCFVVHLILEGRQLSVTTDLPKNNILHWNILTFFLVVPSKCKYT